MEAFTSIEFNKVTAWPVKCVECDVMLHSRVEAAIHEYETEHTCGDVPVPVEEIKRMEEMTERKYFVCIDCGEKKLSPDEVTKHDGHLVMEYWGAKESLGTVN